MLRTLVRALTGHADILVRVAFSPHGRPLATTSDDGRPALGTASLACGTRTLAGHAGVVAGAAFSPQNALVTANADGIAQLCASDQLWVPKTCVTWADALQIAVGATRVRTSGGQVLVRPGGGMIFGLWA